MSASLQFLKRNLLNSQTFPVVFILAMLGILLVLFRMKSVENDYKINELVERIDEKQHELKELKAIKAKQLSIKNLRKISNKYDLQTPKQAQIIVIPK